MKASDLRVGNYLTRKSNPDSLCIVNWGIIKDFEMGELTDYIPIPISEKWFERFGFEKDSSSNFAITQTPEGISYCDSLYIHTYGTALPENERDYHIHNTSIKYVHQLQNIYHALIGEDLIRRDINDEIEFIQ